MSLYIGNCMGRDGLLSLPDKSVDCIITDPPYEDQAHNLQRRLTSTGVAEALLPFPPITETERHIAAGQFGRVVKGWCLIFCQIEAAHKWRAACEASGLVYKRTAIWVKPDAMPQLTGDRPAQGYEAIVIMHGPGKSRWNGGGRSCVFTCSKRNEDQTAHKTQKPLALMEQLVTLFSDPGHIICDPFAGSGTTGVAAIRNGRRFMGWEVDEKYAEIAQRRLSVAREQLTLTELTERQG